MTAFPKNSYGGLNENSYGGPNDDDDDVDDEDCNYDVADNDADDDADDNMMIMRMRMSANLGHDVLPLLSVLLCSRCQLRLNIFSHENLLLEPSKSVQEKLISP